MQYDPGDLGNPGATPAFQQLSSTVDQLSTTATSSKRRRLDSENLYRSSIWAQKVRTSSDWYEDADAGEDEDLSPPETVDTDAGSETGFQFLDEIRHLPPDQQAQVLKDSFKRPGACARCKSLKVKCVREPMSEPCHRCQQGGHDCYIRGPRARGGSRAKKHTQELGARLVAIYEGTSMDIDNPPCSRCRTLQVKCEIRTGANQCNRCLKGGHNCIFDTFSHLLDPDPHLSSDFQQDMRRLPVSSSRSEWGSMYHAKLEVMAPSTGKSLLDTGVVLAWFDGGRSTRVLWVQGGPGTGKTFFVTAVIHRIEASRPMLNSRWPSPIVVLFLDQGRHVGAEAIVSEILHQLGTKSFDPEGAVGFLASGSAVHMFRRVDMILDGFEALEATVRAKLLEVILPLDNVKILITSRTTLGLEGRVRKLVSESVGFLNFVAEPESIREYFTETVSQNPGLDATLEDNASHDAVAHTLARRTGNMFMYAKLQLKALQDQCYSLLDIYDTIEADPREIRMFYQDQLTRLSVLTPSQRSTAERILTWLSHLRDRDGMSARDLRYVVSVDPHTYQVRGNSFIATEALLSACDGLVVMSQSTTQIKLHHPAAHRALSHLTDTTSSNDLIAGTCAMRLTSCAAQLQSCTNAEDLHRLFSSNALLQYSHNNVFYHVRRALLSEHSTVKRLIKEFALNWTSYPYIPSYTHDILDAPIVLSPIHLAAGLGQTSIVEQFLSEGVDPNIPAIKPGSSDNGWTCMHLAAAHGYPSIIEVLLRRPKTHIDPRTEQEKTPFLLASEAGHLDVVTQLWNTGGVDSKLKDNHGRTALMLACMRGHHSVVEFLLREGADAHQVDNDGHSALWLACSTGKRDVVNLLLNTVARIDVNQSGKDGRTPLLAAAANGHDNVFILLILHGEADVNAVDAQGNSALTLAAAHGHAAVVEHIVVSRLDIDMKHRNADGQSALMVASTNGHHEVVEILQPGPRQ